MRRQRGFTLIELLVSLIIIGVVLSMVVVSGTPNPLRALESDAERLTQLFSLAREEAQIRGAPIRFVTEGDRYGFVIFKDRQWRPIEDDTYLRMRQWPTKTRVQVQRADGAKLLEFGRDMIEPPYRVLLSREIGSIVIAGNGLGAFEVLREPAEGARP
ncbi:MAG: GspH/FimT family pseudopilin [Lautropia sp.]|nr:GspH/FimT family pseudopilin [Lautropia sp.]